MMSASVVVFISISEQRMYFLSNLDKSIIPRLLRKLTNNYRCVILYSKWCWGEIMDYSLQQIVDKLKNTIRIESFGDMNRRVEALGHFPGQSEPAKEKSTLFITLLSETTNYGQELPEMVACITQYSSRLSFESFRATPRKCVCGF